MMLRRQLGKSATQLGIRAGHHGFRRGFSATSSRTAEVSLTIDGKQVSIEGRVCHSKPVNVLKC